MTTDGYYGETMRGFVFSCLRCENISAPIIDKDDYYGYMWVKSNLGYFLLRQRIQNGFVLPWVLEVEITPEDSYNDFYWEFRDFLKENPESLYEYCGEPMMQDITKAQSTIYNLKEE